MFLFPKIGNMLSSIFKLFRLNSFITGLLFFVYFLFPSTAPAQDAQPVAIQAEINTDQIPLGSAAQLRITVEGRQDVDPISIPPTDGLEIRYAGPTHNVTIVNGKYSSSVVFNYTVIPMKVGNFQVPSVTISIDGKPYSTQPIMLEVVDSANYAAGTSGSGGSIQEKVFLKLSIPKETVYLHEPIPVRLMLFFTGIQIADVKYPVIDVSGFLISQYDKHKEYGQVINGVSYQIVEFNTVAYPQKVGEQVLGPAKLEGNILIRDSARGGNFRSRFDGFMEDEFLNQFFGNYIKRPFTVTSATVPIVVKDVPAEGKPEGFSGGVGKFDFAATVSPSEVKVGDPLTLRMVIAGTGDLSSVSFPKSELQGRFKSYDPVIKEEAGRKTLEQVVIPLNDAVSEYPKLDFSYFDTDVQQYRTIGRGPFPIKVSPSTQEESIKIIGADASGQFNSSTEETIGEDIVFIKTDYGRLQRQGRRIYHLPIFYVVLFLGIGGLVGGLVHYQLTRRLETDIVYARRYHAPKYAKTGLAKAMHFMKEERKEEFYDEIFKTLQHYLGNKLHLAKGGAAVETITTELRKHKIDESMVVDVKTALEECDAVRYAAATFDVQRMDSSYQRVEKIIDHLERYFK